MRDPLKPMVPDDDQAMVLPCASVMVIIVLLNDGADVRHARRDVLLLAPARLWRGRLLLLLFGHSVELQDRDCGVRYAAMRARPACRELSRAPQAVAFFLPAIGLAGPLRVRALVCVRWPRTGSPVR